MCTSGALAPSGLSVDGRSTVGPAGVVERLDLRDIRATLLEAGAGGAPIGPMQCVAGMVERRT